MNLRVLIIDSSYEAKSSFINKLTGQSVNENPSEFTTAFEKRKECSYTFITTPRLREEDFNQNGARAKSLIRKQLSDYEEEGFHLIIFYTSNQAVSLLTYNTFNFIVWNLSQSVPVICIVNGSETDNNSTHWESQNELTNQIIKNCSSTYVIKNSVAFLKTMDEIWEAIEKRSLKASNIATDATSLQNKKEELRNSLITPLVTDDARQSLPIADPSNPTTTAMKKLTSDLCRGYENLMYNPVNTHVELLMKNCTERQLTDSPYNCVLITTGSFNPIHRFHLQNLLRVKQFLEHEQQPPWNVLMGYVSPTHDAYVCDKLGDQAWIPSSDRCQLCESAIQCEGPEYSSWITISRGECDWKDGFVDFGPVTEDLRSFLNTFLVQKTRWLTHPLTVVYVCGLDHYNKCEYVDHMMKQRNIACAIVFRPGYDEKYILDPNRSKKAMYIPLTDDREKVEDVSSTRIRQHYQKFTGDKKVIPNYLCRAVHEYMLNKYKK